MMVPIAADPANSNNDNPAQVQVGQRLKELRAQSGFSLRALADRSGLNINTLSLIENGKSSPSVSTLQQLALALDVPITSFFESAPAKKHVVFTPADQRPQEVIGRTRMQNLGKDLTGNTVQPFAVILEPGMGSGDRMIIHTGYEFVYCLEGSIRYQIEQEEYLLNPGDSLVFEAHLPHCWENRGTVIARILLVLYPTDERDEPGGHHFSLDYLKKETTMKIAVITDDGKTISQHFGRAPYYLVLTIEDRKVIHREMRKKLGHSQFAAIEHEEHHEQHGMDEASHDRHAQMAEAISDCTVLVCNGMGMGAYVSMRRLNITPIVTDLTDIDAAVQEYLAGRLIDHTEKLH